MSGGGISGAGISGGGLAEGLAWMLHRMITDDGARRRVRARFELALEATRRPELRAAYDEMGRRFRAEAARLLAAGGSAEPERDAWTLHNLVLEKGQSRSGQGSLVVKRLFHLLTPIRGQMAFVVIVLH